MPSLLHVAPSRLWTPSLLCRLNFRDHIRTKLAAEVENGIVVNPAAQASAFTPGLVFSMDNTQGSTSTVIDIVAGFTDQNTVEPSSEEVRPVRPLMIFFLRAHSIMFPRRGSPKPATRVHSLAQCNHAVNLILFPFLYCLGLPLLYHQALYSLNLYSLQRSCSCKLSCMLPERRILGHG
jgi:hypothetical protein